MYVASGLYNRPSEEVLIESLSTLSLPQIMTPTPKFAFPRVKASFLKSRALNRAREGVRCLRKATSRVELRNTPCDLGRATWLGYEHEARRPDCVGHWS